MSGEAVFLDSNVCLYLVSEDSPKKNKAEELLAMPFTVISSQVLNETINVSIKKFRLSQQRIIDHINFLSSSCEVVTVSEMLQRKAIALHFRYQISYYDSLIIASALQAGCTILYSEDLHHGLVVEDKLNVVNPFI